MAAIGLNVRRDGSDKGLIVRSLGATWVRIVLMREHDLTARFQDYRQLGISILAVFARESLAGFNGGADALAYYARTYTPELAALEVGNEPDVDSPSSWTLSQQQLVEYGRLARAAFPGTRLVCGGLASGHPEWLDGVPLDWCDAIAIHPYLRDAANSGDVEDLPDVDDLVYQYQRFGKQVWISEWGWWGAEERRAVEEVRDMIGWAAATDQVGVFTYFALGDDVPPFGLLNADGTPKPRAAPFRAKAENAIAVPLPAPGGVAVLPAPAPAPPPAGPDPWRWWDAVAIAATIQCAESAVRKNWPKLTEQLGHCGIYEMPIAAAMLGTVAIETAHRFEPINEFRNADGSIPDIWWTYDGGPEFHGRGFIQLTHRSNYAYYGPAVAALWGTPMVPDLDLVAVPDRALDPDMSAAISALYFRDHGNGAIPIAARNGDWREVRRLVQGGSAGLADFTRYASTLVASANVKPPVPTPTPAPPPVPVPTDPAEPYILALKTIRDETIPDLEAQVRELRRIVEQFVGAA
jgi:hypothetical protein